MYSGKNPSALRSKEWIRIAFLELLKNKKYSQLTIKEICNQADLSRQTFYQIYESKEEVMQYHFSILFQKFTEECNAFQEITIFQISYCFFQFFYENKDFLEVLVSNNLFYLLEQQFEIYLKRIDIFLKINKEEKYPEYTIAYVAGALTQILIYWFRKDFELNIQELSELTESIIIGLPFKS